MSDFDKAAQIIDECCKYYGTTIEGVSARKPGCPRSDIKRCRLMIAELVNSKTSLTHRENAFVVNRKLHTVTARLKEIGILLKENREMRCELDEIKWRLTGLACERR